jgi:hypothetical protein
MQHLCLLRYAQGLYTGCYFFLRCYGQWFIENLLPKRRSTAQAASPAVQQACSNAIKEGNEVRLPTLETDGNPPILSPSPPSPILPKPTTPLPAECKNTDPNLTIETKDVEQEAPPNVDDTIVSSLCVDEDESKEQLSAAPVPLPMPELLPTSVDSNIETKEGDESCGPCTMHLGMPTLEPLTTDDADLQVSAEVGVYRAQANQQVCRKSTRR